MNALRIERPRPSSELLKENRELRTQLERERQRLTLAEHRAQLAEELSRRAWRLGVWNERSSKQATDE